MLRLMPHLLFWILGYLVVGGAFASSPVQFQAIDGQTIKFSGAPGSTQNAPKAIKTALYDLQYLGTLYPHDDSMPYFLFLGNPCKTCSTERALYLIRPGTDSAKAVITSFVQPGKIYDPRSRALVMESRSFFGHCLRSKSGDSDDTYVLFQKERVDRRHRLQSSVYVATASPDFLRERLIERGFPSLSRTLSLVKAKKCHEVERRNRLMVLKPHGLDWKKLQPSDTDDEDSEPRGDVE